MKNEFIRILKENALPVAHETMVVSKRFVNEKGQPEAWEIRAISGTEGRGNSEELHQAGTDSPLAWAIYAGD